MSDLFYVTVSIPIEEPDKYSIGKFQIHFKYPSIYYGWSFKDWRLERAPKEVLWEHTKHDVISKFLDGLRRELLEAWPKMPEELKNE